jgi:hypothetical protein
MTIIADLSIKRYHVPKCVVSPVWIRPFSKEVVTPQSRDVVSFAEDNEVADAMTGLGWSPAEHWGRWMRGHEAGMVFKVPVPVHRDLRMELSVIAFVLPTHPVQRVGISVNGEPLPQQTFARSADAVFGLDKPVHSSLLIPARSIDVDGLVRLVFKLPDAASPALLGLSQDPRELSIGVTQLRVEDAGG